MTPYDSFLQLPSLKRSPRTRTTRTNNPVSIPVSTITTTSPPRPNTAVRGGGSTKCHPSPPCTSLEGRTLCIIPEEGDDEVVIMPAMNEEEDAEETPDSPSIYSVSPMPSPSDQDHNPNPSLSRRSSIKSISDSDSALEARLSAYEFSIDDALFNLVPTALSAPRVFASSQLPLPLTTSPPPSFFWSGPTGEGGYYYYDDGDQDDDDFFCSTSPVNATTTNNTITCLTTTTTASSNSKCISNTETNPDSFRLTFPDVSLKFPHPPEDAYTRSFSLSHSNSQSQSQLQPQSQAQTYPHPYSLPHPHTPPPTKSKSKTMSPTRSISSTSTKSTNLTASTHSSPSSHNSDLPTTPTSSDDGILLLSQSQHPTKGVGIGIGVRGRTRPKRASISPLVIVKPVVRVVCEDDNDDDGQEGEEREEAYVGLGLRYRLPSEVLVTAKPHPFVQDEGEKEKQPEVVEEVEEEGEDYEFLNEWYTEQLSSAVTLHSASSPHPSQSFHPQRQSQSLQPHSEVQTPTSPTYYAPARPDSIFMLSPLPRFSFTPSPASSPAPTPAPTSPQPVKGKGESGCDEVTARPVPDESSRDGNSNPKTKPLPEIPAVLMPSDPTLPRRKRTVVSGTGSVLELLESAGLAPFVSERDREGRKEVGGGGGGLRPPPRSSVPVDLAMDEWVDPLQPPLPQPHHIRRSNGAGGHRNTISRPAPTVDLAEFVIEEDLPLKFPVSLPTSPVDPVELETEFGVELRLGGRSHHQHQQQQQQQQQQPLLARSSSAVSATAAIRAGVPSTMLIPRSDPSMEPALPETPTWDMYSPIATSTSSNARTLSLSSSNTRTTQPPSLPTDQDVERALYSRWSITGQKRVMAVKRESEKVDNNNNNNKESMKGSSMFRSYFDFGSKSKKGRRNLRFSSLSSSSSSTAAAAAAAAGRNRNEASNKSAKNGNYINEMNPISPFSPFPSSPRSPMSYMFPTTPPPSKKEFSVRSRAGRLSNESEKMFSAAAGVVRRSTSRSSISTNASVSANSECGSCERQMRKQIPVEMFIKC